MIRGDGRGAWADDRVRMEMLTQGSDAFCVLGHIRQFAVQFHLHALPGQVLTQHRFGLDLTDDEGTR